jgi:hypothetical protein
MINMINIPPLVCFYWAADRRRNSKKKAGKGIWSR